MEKYKEKENRLKLIPKAENYCTYIINVIIKLPRTEKFSIGIEYKKSVYQMINYIMYLNKIKNSIVIPNGVNTKSNTFKYELQASLIYDLINNTNTFLFELKSKPVIKN